MNENKHKPWTASECSVLYHLIMWGYGSKEAIHVAEKFIKTRTRDGIQVW